MSDAATSGERTARRSPRRSERCRNAATSVVAAVARAFECRRDDLGSTPDVCAAMHDGDTATHLSIPQQPVEALTTGTCLASASP